MGWLDAPAKEQPTNPYPYLDLSGVSGKTLEEKIQRLQMHNTDVLNAVNQAAADYYARTKKPLPVTSGARTWDEQNDLYQRHLKGEKGIFMPINPEGKSKDYVFHRDAFDIPAGVADQELKAYGLHRPLGAKDPVHVTLRTPMAKEDDSWLSSPVAEKKEEPKDEWKPVAETMMENGEVPAASSASAPSMTADEAHKSRVLGSNAVTYGGGAGLATGVATKLLTNPENIAFPESSAIDPKEAKAAVAKANANLATAEQRLAERIAHPGDVSGGKTMAELEAEYKQAKFLAENANDEFIAAQAASKIKTPAATPSVTVEAAPAPHTAPSVITNPNELTPTQTQVERGLQGTTKDTGITGRASQTMYNERTHDIATGAKNQERVLQELTHQGVVTPEGILKNELALGTKASTPTGVIAPIEDIKHMELNNQLKTIAETSADNEKRVAAAQELERLKQAKINASTNASQAKKQMEAAQRAKTSSVTKAENAVRVAEDKAKTAAQLLEESKAAPGALRTMTQNLGANVGKAMPIIGNTLGGLGTGMSVAEAYDRYLKGDTTGVVLSTLEAAFGGLSMLPPVTPLTAIGKGVGIVGGLGMIPIQMARDKWFPYQPPKQ